MQKIKERNQKIENSQSSKKKLRKLANQVPSLSPEAVADVNRSSLNYLRSINYDGTNRSVEENGPSYNLLIENANLKLANKLVKHKKRRKTSMHKKKKEWNDSVTIEEYSEVRKSKSKIKKIKSKLVQKIKYQSVEND